MAYLPGTEGGTAVADVILGQREPERAPSGDLAVAAAQPGGDFCCHSRPSPTPGDQPEFLPPACGYQLSARASGITRSTRSVLGSRTRNAFRRAHFRSPASVSKHADVTATFTLTNSGSRAGAAVVPVYARAVGDVVAPPRRLVGFARVTLSAGASQVVHVLVPRLRCGRHARRHRRDGAACGGARRVSGRGRFDDGGLLRRKLTDTEMLEEGGRSASSRAMGPRRCSPRLRQSSVEEGDDAPLVLGRLGVDPSDVPRPGTSQMAFG